MMDKEQQVTYSLHDDAIAVIRELVTLALITGTNIVDHLRAARFDAHGTALVPTEEYVKQYNAYIEDLAKKAEELKAERESNILE